MIIIGVLLIAAAAGFAIDVFVENSATIDVDVLGRTFTVDPGWLVVAGVVACAVLFAGVRLIGFGLARRHARRETLRDAQRAARERDQLARQLEVERSERNRDESATAEVDQTHSAEQSETTSPQSST
jgi:hypothetical protein